MSRHVVLAALVLWAFASSARVHAHPLAPVSVIIEEQAEREYKASFRRSARARPLVEISWPKNCQTSAPQETTEPDGSVRDDLLLSCSRGLEGQSIGLTGLPRAGVGALLYVAFRNGHHARAVLGEDERSYVIPRAATARQVFRDYVRLGIEHLLTGYDHLLFVFGLSLLVRGVRRIALSLTAFTIGHSITLCLASLELVSVPSAPVEIGIALSLVVVALELLATPKPNVVRATFAMAFSFGLLHGLGFAGALGEAGLPKHAIPLSLFAFNAGVELGQLAVLLVLSPLLYLYARQPSPRARMVRGGFAYVIGSLAAMWCIERATRLF